MGSLIYKNMTSNSPLSRFIHPIIKKNVKTIVCIWGEGRINSFVVNGVLHILKTRGLAAPPMLKRTSGAYYCIYVRTWIVKKSLKSNRWKCGRGYERGR